MCIAYQLVLEKALIFAKRIGGDINSCAESCAMALMIRI